MNSPDIDIIPNLSYYERLVVDYAPLVLGLFQMATSLLQGDLTLEQMAAGITREIAHLNGPVVVLAAAESGLAGTQTELEKGARR